MADDHVHCSEAIRRCGAREYLEAMIGHERELRMTSEARLGEALRLQATEYERRLDSLNNEHARVAAAQAMFISRETFETSRREEATWRIDIQSRIERTAAALPQYVTREMFDAAQQADRVWKNGVASSLAEAKGASARMVYIVALVMGLMAIGLRFIPGI